MSTAKLIYKPDSQKTEEFILFVNPEAYKKYAAGDTDSRTNAIASYDVFVSTQGNQGKLGTPSKQTLNRVFGSEDGDVIVEFMLKNGVMQHADRIDKNATANMNMSRGTGATSTR